MTIIVFLVDTSASMAMKTYLGTTYLDFARKTIEEFMKQFQQRQIRDQTNRDRYMLMTFEDYPQNVKVGWKEGVKIFEEQLKNLKTGGITSFGPAFGSALRFVSLNRLQTGLENYGFGRNPTYTDPVVFIAITDGTSLSDPKDGVVNEIRFSKPDIPGFEMTDEPFRWDQRLFSIVLRLPGGAPTKLKTPFTIPSDQSRIEDMCQVTGGRSYSLSHHKMLSACVEMIIQKIQMNGVLVKLEKFGPDPPPHQNGVIGRSSNMIAELLVNGTNGIEPDSKPRLQFEEGAWSREQLVMILRPNRFITGATTAFWPIPEAYWPDGNLPTLPPRKAHPKVLFKCEQVDPIINTDFPFDKYELEYCPLVQYILDRKQPNLCWQVYVSNSYKSPLQPKTDNLGQPFGYLKVSSNMQSVTLVILPYNYPVLMQILDDGKDKRIRSSAQWMNRLERYFATVPAYYMSSLKKHLKKLNINHPIIDDPYKDQIYSTQVISHLTKIKYIGKEEYDKACGEVSRAIQETAKLELDRIRNLVPVRKVEKRGEGGDDKKMRYQPSAVVEAMGKIPHVLDEKYKDYKISIMEPKLKPVPSTQFYNAFDIDRDNLLEQLSKMTINLEMQLKSPRLQLLEGGKPGTKIRLQHADDLHNQPIARMGDYQLYAQLASQVGMGPLRELEPQAAKPHAFGNPFKLDKKNMSIIDEVGEANSSLPSSSPKNSADRQERQQVSAEKARRRRKQGPVDRAALDTWKKRRRSRSFSSDMSDTSSIASDISDVSSLEGDFAVMDQGSVNGFATPPMTPEHDTLSDGYASEDGAKFSPTSKKLNGLGSSLKHPLQVHPSTSIDSMDEDFEKPAKRPRTDSSSSIPRTPTSLMSPQTQSSFKHQQEQKELLHDLKNELAKIVRRIGNRGKLYPDIMAKLKPLSDEYKAEVLWYAWREANRFKVRDLEDRLQKEMNRLKKKKDAEEQARNNSKDLLSDILGQ